jgi:3-mercaptopyruvate sulfurtransferase SseA
MKRTKNILLATFFLLLTSLACNALFQQNLSPSDQAPVPTQIVVSPQITELVSTRPASTPPPTSANLPENDAEVPRVPVDQARAAFDSGKAIIVDVRGADAYARSHIAGALEISLSAIQTDPANLPLDKNKWIITYCT